MKPIHLIVSLLLALYFLSAEASATTVAFIGKDGRKYELSPTEPFSWQSVSKITVDAGQFSDDMSYSPNGDWINYRDDGTFEHGIDHRSMETSPLRPPPPGIEYKQAHLDGDGNLWVELGGNGRGFNFVSDEDQSVIVANRMRWKNSPTPGLLETAQLVADAKNSGAYALLQDGSLEYISAPFNEAGEFGRERLLPAGSVKSIATGPECVVINYGQGKTGLLKDGKILSLPPLPVEGEILSNYDRHFTDRMRRLEASLPPAPASPTPTKPAPKAVNATKAVNFERPTSKPVEYPAQELAREIASRRSRVPEFKFIEEEAAKIGARVWLFGGTASGYAHYVNWDMQRERGDTRYQPDRFNYDYTNIYRSTQDLDIVMDGTEAQAQALQSKLAENFPHFQGGKSAWEVRLLRGNHGDKEALLGNPNYLNQHTDSNSTGMIELTHPPAGEPVVRDLRDWQAREPYFLRDVHEQKLHYYFSPSHGSTTRAKEGKNPPILSAIRYLTKAFQYDLELRPEDVKVVQRVIDDFDPAAPQDEYVARWIEKNGKKLLQNAVNIEYAWKKLRELGLAEKLAAIKKNPTEVDSLAWWMNKQPLLSKPVGQGSGRTAAEIFAQYDIPIDEKGRLLVAHEPRTYLAYESITRAHTGEPNVLISRQNHAGEMAAFGDGFYTLAGREGAAGSGLHIRFALDPKAREGTDFIFVPDNNFFVLQNKNAYRVAPDSLNLTLKGFFETIAQEESSLLQDKGVLEKLRRQVLARAAIFDKSEIAEVAGIIKKNLRPRERALALLEEWLKIPDRLRAPYQEEIGRAVAKLPDLRYDLAALAAREKTWQNIAEISPTRERIEAWNAAMLPLMEEQAKVNQLRAASPGYNPRHMDMQEEIQEKMSSQFLRIFQQGEKNPDQKADAIKYVKSEVEKFYFHDRVQLATRLLQGTTGKISAEAADFALEYGYSYGSGGAFLDETVEKELLERYFYPGAVPLKPEEMENFLSSMSAEGKLLVLREWRRFAPFISAEMAKNNLFNALSQVSSSLPYSLEQASSDQTKKTGQLLEEFRAFVRSYRKNIFPLLDVEERIRLDNDLYRSQKFAKKYAEHRNQEFEGLGNRILYDEFIEPETRSLAKTSDYFERRLVATLPEPPVPPSALNRLGAACGSLFKRF